MGGGNISVEGHVVDKGPADLLQDSPVVASEIQNLLESRVTLAIKPDLTGSIRI